MRQIWEVLDEIDRLQYWEAQQLDKERYEKDQEMIISQSSPSKAKKRLNKAKANFDIKLTDRSIFTNLTREIDIDKYLDILGYRL